MNALGFFNILVLFSALWSTSCQVVSLSLLPFGKEHGDTNIPTGDDPSSGKISLDPPLMLSGKRFGSIYVSINTNDLNSSKCSS